MEQDKEKLTHYQKYKETIKRNVDKYMANPENKKKVYRQIRERQMKKKEEFENMKKKLEELKNLIG
jgi:aminoglycoside N3'-acetyltransferase